MVISKECKKQEWSKQYTPRNPFQRGQQEDQRYAGRMMLKKKKDQKCQIGRPFSRIGEVGRKWLRRPKLCTKSCRAVIRRRRMWVLPTNTECQVCDKSQLLNRCVNLHVEN